MPTMDQDQEQGEKDDPGHERRQPLEITKAQIDDEHEQANGHHCEYGPVECEKPQFQHRVFHFVMPDGKELLDIFPDR